MLSMARDDDIWVVVSKRLTILRTIQSHFGRHQRVVFGDVDGSFLTTSGGIFGRYWLSLRMVFREPARQLTASPMVVLATEAHSVRWDDA